MAALAPMVGVLFTVFFTWVLYGWAQQAEAGEQIEITGRRKGIIRILASFAEMLGTTGVIIIGVLALAYFIYKSVKEYKTPAMGTNYIKKV